MIPRAKQVYWLISWVQSPVVIDGVDSCRFVRKSSKGGPAGLIPPLDRRCRFMTSSLGLLRPPEGEAGRVGKGPCNAKRRKTRRH